MAKVVLRKDLVIPKGTVLTRAPGKTIVYREKHFETGVRIGDNIFALFVVSTNGDEEHFQKLKEYFGFLED